MIDPLHPAVVHFPIVLVLLGTVACLCSFLFLKREMILFAMICLVLGAVGSYVAVETGGDAWDAFSSAYPEAKDALHDHADWGDKAMPIAIAAGVLSIIAFFTGRHPKAGMFFKVITLAVAGYASYAIYKTAEHGGEMVYGDAMKISKSDTD